MKKRNEKIILGIIIILAIVFIGKAVLSFSPTIPPFPSAIATLANPISISCPYNGGFISTSSAVYYNNVTPIAYIYEGIQYQFPMSSTCVYEYPYGTPGSGSYGSNINLALPVSYSNLSDVEYALKYDNATLANAEHSLSIFESDINQYI